MPLGWTASVTSAGRSASTGSHGQVVADVRAQLSRMVRALALALLEAPRLLSRPLPPLDELLYMSLERDGALHYWRDRAAAVSDAVSFGIDGMPQALYAELNHRATRYGMSFDQYVVAVLGRLAWRTPFAEDMEPRESWDPDRKAGAFGEHGPDRPDLKHARLEAAGCPSTGWSTPRHRRSPPARSSMVGTSMKHMPWETSGSPPGCPSRSTSRRASCSTKKRTDAALTPRPRRSTDQETPEMRWRNPLARCARRSTATRTDSSDPTIVTVLRARVTAV